MLIVAVVLHCYQFSVSGFFLELLGIVRPTMAFCWYVDFYIVSIFLLPIIYRIIRKSAFLGVLVGILFPSVATGLLYRFQGFDVNGSLKNFFFWFPCIFIGSFFAEYTVFETVFDKALKIQIKPPFLRMLIWIVLLFVCFMGRFFSPSYTYIISFSLDVLYTPLLVYCLVNIVYVIPKYQKVLFPIAIIGKYSLPMWFLHGLFFNSCREYTQGLLYWPKNPLLILIWGLGVCFLCSFIIMKPIKWIINKKNGLLHLS